MKKDTFSPGFSAELKRLGYPVGDIERDIKESPRGRKDQEKIIRRWTGFSNQRIQEGAFNQDRDTVLPTVGNAITAELQPWITVGTAEEMPTVSAKELARSTGLSVQKIVDILNKYPFEFSVNGTHFTATAQKPSFKNGSSNLEQVPAKPLNPKRLQREARYLSRPPGGGPIQKARIDESRIPYLKQQKIVENTVIEFNPIQNGEIEKPEKPKAQSTNNKERSFEEVFYSEPKGAELMEAYKWFAQTGDKKNWLTGDGTLFAEKLVALSKGKPVDFLIWNCIGLDWQQEQRGQYPKTVVINNLDTAITFYFKKRIQEMAEKLGKIGDPNIIILVPTNEAIADNLGAWEYIQPIQEREKLMDETVKGLTSVANAIQVPPDNTPVRVMRWDEYLESRGAKTQTDYTLEGIKTIQELPDKDMRIVKAIDHARLFFGQFGINVEPTKEVGQRQMNYLSVYVGEGVASRGNMIGTRDMVWVNFEEPNVSKSEYLGAEGNIAIVTPATESEIDKYYKWKKKVIAARGKS